MAEKLKVTILPTMLSIEHVHAFDVREIEIREEFEEFLEDLAPKAVLVQYEIDQKPYYHAFFGGGDNQMMDICLVKAWYYLKK